MVDVNPIRNHNVATIGKHQGVADEALVPVGILNRAIMVGVIATRVAPEAVTVADAMDSRRSRGGNVDGADT